MTSVRASEISWSCPNGPALDLNGPTVPFRPFRDDWVEQPVLDLFRSTVAEFGDRIACEDLAGRLTYAQLWTACRRLAASIEAAVPSRRPVGILLPNEAAYPVAILACLAADRPCVTIDRHHPEDRIAAIVRDAGLEAIILRRSDISEGLLLPAGVRTLAIDEALEGGPGPDRLSASSTPPGAPSFIVYTSGSTGQPKGIAISQRAILHRVGQLINAVHFRPDDKLLSLASPSTIAGLQHIFEALLTGAALVKLDLQRTGLGRIVQAIGEMGITMMFSTPAVWRSVARVDGVAPALATLRCVHSSGDSLLAIDLEQLRQVLPPECHVLSSYGATEAPAMLQWFVPKKLPTDGPRVPAGYPLPGFAFALLDDSGTAAKDETPGELVVKSPWMSLGLWRDGAVHPGLFQQDMRDFSAPVHCTGDIASRGPGGLIVMLGRKDRQIKIMGNRVELAEIETTLRQAPDVADAAVVARSIEGEPRLFAFVVPSRASSSSFIAAVRQHLQERLPAYMQPTDIVVREDLPLLPGRKIDEDALLAHAAGHASAEPGPCSAPATTRPTPRSTDMVSRAWKHAFGHPPSDEGRSFDEAGGNSLRLLLLIFQLERSCGRTLLLDDFHGGLKPAEFALALDRVIDGQLPEAQGSLPTVFLVPGRWGDTPLLARFRMACANDIRIVATSYPDLRCLARGNFEDIVVHLSAQIEQSAPEGPILLAGYSMGGDFAYAVAGRLSRRSREIAALLVLDTNIEDAGSGGLPRQQRSLGRRFSTLCRLVGSRDWGTIAESILTPSVVTSPVGLRVLRFLLLFGSRANSRFILQLSCHLRSMLVEFHRGSWIRHVPAIRLDIPVVLFRSEDGGDDLGWRARTDRLTIIPVAGDHVSMLDRGKSEVLVAEFNRAVHIAAGRDMSPAGR